MNRRKIILAVALALAVIGAGLGVVACQQQDASLEARVRYGLNTREDVVLHSGADLVMYSDDHSTVKFTVDGSTGAIDSESSLDMTSLNVVAPTAIATATPAALINSTGVSALLELRKASTPVFQVNGSGNVDIEGTLDVNSTSDLKGDLADSGGTLTIADNAKVDGQADTTQFTVEGNATQTSPLIRAQKSDATAVMLVKQPPAADFDENMALLYLAGTMPNSTSGTNYLQGIRVDLASGIPGGTSTNYLYGVQIDNIPAPHASVEEIGLSIQEGWDTALQTLGKVVIDGSADAIQLTVQGYVTQTNALVVVEESGGTDVVTIKQSPAADADGGIMALATVAGTMPNNTTGSTMMRGLDISLDAGNPSGGTNALYGVYVNGISGDAQSDETGMYIADGWDIGLNVGSNVIQQTLGVENIGLPSVICTPITYTAAAGGSGTVATVGSGEIWLVHEVWIQVTESFAADGDDATLIVGDGDDTNGFLDVADAGLQSTYAAATGWATGYYGLKDGEQGAYTADGSMFVYDGSETIDWAVGEGAGTTLSAGAATICVRYTRIQ